MKVLAPDTDHRVEPVAQDDSGDEDEQDRVAHAVQLLMDCVADMVVHEGVENMGKMTAGGMSLYPPHRPKYVRGQFPEKMGGGQPLHASSLVDHSLKVNSLNTAKLPMLQTLPSAQPAQSVALCCARALRWLEQENWHHISSAFRNLICHNLAKS